MRFIDEDNFRDYLDEEELEKDNIKKEEIEGGEFITRHNFIEGVKKGFKPEGNFLTCCEIPCDFCDCANCIFDSHIYLTRKGADIYERFNNK